MKFIFPLFILSLVSLTVSAQTQINENFDVSCFIDGTDTTQWSNWNTTEPVSALGWKCAALSGRWGSGAAECASFFGGVNYKDTAWLFTPELHLAGYSGNVFLRFDAKHEFIASRMQVLVSHDNSYHVGTRPDTSGVDWANVTSATNPVINPDADSALWVTHEVNLTPYKGAPLFVAFKFISSSSVGGIWTIDNVFTTQIPLDVKNVHTENLPITVLGNSSSSNIRFSCSFITPGAYRVSVTDLLGREVHTETITAQLGSQSFDLTGLQLVPGMYMIKVGNEAYRGIAKTVVQ